MRYIKPAILSTSKATAAIRGEKQASPNPDSQSEPFLVTISAYKSDE